MNELRLKFHFFTLIKVRNIFKQRIAVTASDKNLDLLFRVISFNPKMKINKISIWSTHLKKVNCWKKNCNCREILRMEFIFSKIAGLQLATLLKNELLHRYFPVTLSTLFTLLTFCEVPMWRTQHELSKATFGTINPRISEAAHWINFNARKAWGHAIARAR